LNNILQNLSSSIHSDKDSLSVSKTINVIIFCKLPEIFHCLTNQRNHINIRDEQFHPFVLYFTEIKNLINKMKHPVGIAFYGFKLLSQKALFLRGHALRDAYKCQRRPQLMRDIRKKAQFYVGNPLFDRHFMTKAKNGKKNIYGAEDKK
jgi:hypothetical protein